MVDKDDYAGCGCLDPVKKVRRKFHRLAKDVGDGHSITVTWLVVSNAEPTPVIRRADNDDISAIVRTAGAALGWSKSEPNEALFRWKHLDNPFGASPMWVAELAGEMVGFRTFLRWQWLRHGEVVSAVRAVDTATLPAAQGKGVFTALTKHALGDLEHMGVEFVFNTPNSKSLPGYLRMGWTELGRVPVSARVRRPWSLRGARTAADKWSMPTTVGCRVEDVSEQLIGVHDSQMLCTNRSAEYLAWRYGLEALAYRGFSHPRGAAIFRLRRRGTAIECTVCEISGGKAVLRALLKATNADYLIVAGRPKGAVAVAKSGPVFTTRSVTTNAPTEVGAFGFSLGDIELF